MTAASTWLVTGASRGLGLEHVRQIVKRGNVVFAAVRSPDKATELVELQNASAQGSIEIVEMDVLKPQSIESAAKLVESILQDRGLDYLINNAGIMSASNETPSIIDPDEMMSIYQTNVVGSVLVYQKFLPLLKQSKRPGGPVLVNMSSGLGSIARIKIRGNPIPSTSYSVSKAALNMLTAKQASEHPNIIVLSLSPGWVKTEMGGSDALIDADVSVKGQLGIITAATLEDSGRFKVYDGTEYPW